MVDDFPVGGSFIGLSMPEGSRRRIDEDEEMNERGEWEGEAEEVNRGVVELEVDATGASVDSAIAWRSEWSLTNQEKSLNLIPLPVHTLLECLLNVKMQLNQLHLPLQHLVALPLPWTSWNSLHFVSFLASSELQSVY